MNFNKWLKRRDPKLYNEYAAALGKMAGGLAKNPKMQQAVGGLAKKHGPQAMAALQKKAPGMAKMVQQHGPQAMDMAKKHGPEAMKKMQQMMQQKGGAQGQAGAMDPQQMQQVQQGGGAQAGAMDPKQMQQMIQQAGGEQGAKKPGIMGRIGKGVGDFAKGALGTMTQGGGYQSQNQ